MYTLVANQWLHIDKKSYWLRTRLLLLAGWVCSLSWPFEGQQWSRDPGSSVEGEYHPESHQLVGHLDELLRIPVVHNSTFMLFNVFESLKRTTRFLTAFTMHVFALFRDSSTFLWFQKPCLIPQRCSETRCGWCWNDSLPACRGEATEPHFLVEHSNSPR